MPDYEKMSDRELDAAVAEKVMGWKLYDYENGRYAKTEADYVDAYTNDGWGWEGKSGDEYAHQWSPSTDISAAWEVVERMLNANPAESIARWRFDLRLIADQFFVSFNNRLGSDGSSAGHDHAKVTRAICLAALAAVAAKEKTNG